MGQPSGVVTFLFTDVEGSTRLWAEHTDAMDRAIAQHDTVLREAVSAHRGHIFSTGGDGFGIAFAAPAAAVAAAIDGQRALSAGAWPGLPAPLRVRMGIHAGTSHERGGDYFGPNVNLAARVMAAAWGRQILCTSVVAGAADAADARTDSLGAHRLRDVPSEVELHQVVAADLPVDFPAPRTLDRAPSTVPAQRSSFVGRQEEVEAVRRLLLEERLITLTGFGGTGKTRLAVEVAGREAPRRPGGTFFADLSSLDRGDLVAATVARACLAPPDPGRSPTDQVIDRLTDCHALVVLDTCEHLLDAVAELIDQMLAACPGVAILATSRTSLDLPGEHLHVVEPLPPRGPDARSLLVQRAALTDTVLDPDDPVLAELCGRLEGIPLAIELAAARTRSLSPAQILEHVDARRDVPAVHRRGTPDRHQTLRATIDWSYRLLDEDEQDMFARIAVFAGAFDLGAAVSVVAGDLERVSAFLEGMVSKSMVVTQPAAGGGLRFRLLDSMRAYAGERLATNPAVAAEAVAAHDLHHLSLLATASPERVMSHALAVEVEAVLDDVRLALGRADPAIAGGLVADASFTFSVLLTNLGYITEARTWCDAALAVPRSRDAVRGRLLIARAYRDATEDGTSGYALDAGEALRLLEPGDGVWSAAVGLTSVPQQMFAPADALVDLASHRARLDGLGGSGATVDRATVDFYRGGALLNLRHFEEGVDVLLGSSEALASLEPTNLVRLWSASGAAIGHTLDGHPDRALECLATVESDAGWTDWAVEWAFAESFALAGCGRTEDARRALCRIGERLGFDAPSSLAGTVLAGFGALAVIEGRLARATELLERLVATRSTASTAALYELVGELEGWEGNEFANRKVHRAMLGAGRQQAMTRQDYFSQVTALARAEVIRATTEEPG